MTGQWLPVAAVADLPPGSAAARALAGAGEVAVFNVDGELCAVDGSCPHRGGPLAEGMVRNGVVTCPLHWFRYDLRTGKHLGQRSLRLTCYPVRVVDGTVEVLVPPAPPEMSLRERLLAAGREWKASGSRAPGSGGPGGGA